MFSDFLLTLLSSTSHIFKIVYSSFEVRIKGSYKISSVIEFHKLMLHIFELKAVEVSERRRCIMINAVALAYSSCLTMIIKLSEVIIRHK